MSTWNAEQVLSLAPDAASAKAGQQLATLSKWVSLCFAASIGTAGALWGECQGSGKNPYRTQIDLSEPAFKCSCPSRKFPCKHGLGLLLLWAGQRSAFKEDKPPDWVSEWLSSRLARAQKQAEKGTPAEPVDSKAQEKRAVAREKKVAAGVAELELWLHDVVRRGLAKAGDYENSFYEGMAARLVDAQASGLARLVRELAVVPLTGAGWQSRLLEKLARLHLLLEAFKRLETLPPATQADVRLLIGWTQNQDELLAQSGVRDEWLVLGRRIEEDERLRTARTWLWGRNINRVALVLDFAPLGRPLELSLAPGALYDAELVFFPGAAPQRALVKRKTALSANDSIKDSVLPGYQTVPEALAACAAQRTLNPWLERFALPVQNVIPLREINDGRELWHLRDVAHHVLPITARFVDSDEGWKLLAHSGARPIGVFGEWDGDVFLPLAVQGQRGLLAL